MGAAPWMGGTQLAELCALPLPDVHGRGKMLHSPPACLGRACCLWYSQDLGQIAAPPAAVQADLSELSHCGEEVPTVPQLRPPYFPKNQSEWLS